MSESLLLRSADVEVLAGLLADAVAKRVEPLITSRQRILVDRPTMAELANISIPMLDRLVASKRIPSVNVGARRLFDPDRVVNALIDAGGATDAEV
jgi:hypothetical protein